MPVAPGVPVDQELWREPTMRRFAFAIVAVVWIDVQAALPIPPPKPVESPSLSTMRSCQIFSVRAAWGAQARFKGAPSAFKYAARATVYEYFMTDNAPHDGIYVAEDLDLPDRRAYEEVAVFGWQQMDRWLSAAPDRPEPDWAAFPAVFYQMCKDAASGKPDGASNP